jgi:hypothetical protein
LFSRHFACLGCGFSPQPFPSFWPYFFHVRQASPVLFFGMKTLHLYLKKSVKCRLYATFPFVECVSQINYRKLTWFFLNHKKISSRSGRVENEIKSKTRCGDGSKVDNFLTFWLSAHPPPNFSNFFFVRICAR